MTAMYWVWFGVAWLFVFAVLFSRWRHREHADKAATEAELKRTKAYTGTDHWGDA